MQTILILFNNHQLMWHSLNRCLLGLQVSTDQYLLFRPFSIIKIDGASNHLGLRQERRSQLKLERVWVHSQTLNSITLAVCFAGGPACKLSILLHWYRLNRSLWHAPDPVRKALGEEWVQNHQVVLSQQMILLSRWRKLQKRQLCLIKVVYRQLHPCMNKQLRVNWMWEARLPTRILRSQ